jgi:hypothetical protein
MMRPGQVVSGLHDSDQVLNQSPSLVFLALLVGVEMPASGVRVYPSLTGVEPELVRHHKHPPPRKFAAMAQVPQLVENGTKVRVDRPRAFVAPTDDPVRPVVAGPEMRAVPAQLEFLV